VLVCYRVTGEEEVPEGVVGVLTPDAPDVLSHLSVRARNMKVSSAAQHLAAPRAGSWDWDTERGRSSMHAGMLVTRQQLTVQQFVSSLWMLPGG